MITLRKQHQIQAGLQNVRHVMVRLLPATPAGLRQILLTGIHAKSATVSFHQIQSRRQGTVLKNPRRIKPAGIIISIRVAVLDQNAAVRHVMGMGHPEDRHLMAVAVLELRRMVLHVTYAIDQY